MHPILVLQHEEGVSAGHFASWLAARGLTHTLVCVHHGDPVPKSASAYAGLCSLGGNMSVNDPLSWIDAEVGLLRDAVARGVPVIGHCLGGQLLARALGAPVTRNPHKEMGWWPVDVEDPALVQEWLGTTSPAELFHWHGDAFDLPAGARRLLSSPLTPNQAYVVERHGIEHLGMQFHIEMTPELVLAWARDPGAEAEVAEERLRTGGAGVQSPEAMCEALAPRTAAMQVLAWRLYDRWARGLKR